MTDRKVVKKFSFNVLNDLYHQMLRHQDYVVRVEALLMAVTTGGEYTPQTIAFTQPGRLRNRAVACRVLRIRKEIKQATIHFNASPAVRGP